MTLLFPNIETLLERRGIEREDSYDYGCWWRDDAPQPARLTWIGPQWRDDSARAGELYLQRLGGSSGPVELLCVVPPATCDGCTSGTPCPSAFDHDPSPDASVESILDGWAGVCGEPNSIAWIRDRVAEAIRAGWAEEASRSNRENGDTTDRRVRTILSEGFVAAYGSRVRSPNDGPDARCTCDHRADAHAGEEWEGACLTDDCGCDALRLEERSC